MLGILNYLLVTEEWQLEMCFKKKGISLHSEDHVQRNTDFGIKFIVLQIRQPVFLKCNTGIFTTMILLQSISQIHVTGLSKLVIFYFHWTTVTTSQYLSQEVGKGLTENHKNECDTVILSHTHRQRRWGKGRTFKGSFRISSNY